MNVNKRTNAAKKGGFLVNTEIPLLRCLKMNWNLLIDLLFGMQYENVSAHIQWEICNRLRKAAVYKSVSI